MPLALKIEITYNIGSITIFLLFYQIKKLFLEKS